MKTIADFVSLPDLSKLILLDLQPASQLNEQTWTQHGTYTNVYYLSHPEGEIVKVEEGGVEYDEEFSISDCNGNASSFYYDDYAQILYVRTSGSDSPAALSGSDPKYCITAYWWKIIGNRPRVVERADQLIVNNIFNYWTTSSNAENWTEATSGTSTVAQSTTVDDDRIELYTCKITIDGSGNQASTYYDVSTKPRRKCKVRIRYKAPVGSGLVRVYDTGSNVWLNGNSQWQTTIAACIMLSNTSTVATLELEFIAHKDYSDYRIMVLSAVASSQIFISEVQFWRYYQPVYAKPLLPTELPNISQSVGSYLMPESQISVGEIVINNGDGWWWDIGQSDKYLWHNKRIIVRGGALEWDNEDFPIFFYGLMREPMADIGEVRLAGYDDRLTLKTLPINRFDSTNYPNCPTENANKPIPFVLGGVGSGHIFNPLECDDSSYIYKVSDTFGGSYPVYAVSDVWKDGVHQTVTTHYTVNLTNGTITFVSDPGTAEITCRIQGLTNYSPFVSGLAMLPADFLYFILVILNGIDKHRLNLSSFKDLYDNRVIGAQEVILSDEDSIDIINRLQITAIFQIFTRLDGTIEARRYNSDIPDDILHLRTNDIAEWSLENDTDHTFKELVIQYKPNFAEGTYEEMYIGGSPPFDADKIEWEHGIKDRLILDSRLETTLQAWDLHDNIMAIMEDPIRILDFRTTNHGALLLNPTDKIKVTIEANYDGVDKTILDDETFQVLSLDKDLNTGETHIIAFTGWSQFYWVFT